MPELFIYANDRYMGSYQANDPHEAILAYVKDAGYTSVEAAADACNQTVEAFLSSISVRDTFTFDDED